MKKRALKTINDEDFMNKCASIVTNQTIKLA